MDRRRHRSAPTSSRGRPRAARPASPAATAPWACSDRHVASDRDAHRMGQRSMRYFVARPLRQQEGRHENNHCHGSAGRLDNCRTMRSITTACIISIYTLSVDGATHLSVVARERLVAHRRGDRVGGHNRDLGRADQKARPQQPAEGAGTPPQSFRSRCGGWVVQGRPRARTPQLSAVTDRAGLPISQT